MPSASDVKSRGIALIWIGALALLCLHQDVWWWDDQRLLFGFLPVGLGYHALFSIFAASLWAMAVRVAWPDHLEDWAATPEETSGEDAPAKPQEDTR